MDIFLKIVEQLIPIISFYLLWAKLLFAITLGLLLVSIFVFVILYSSASEQKKASGKEDFLFIAWEWGQPLTFDEFAYEPF